MELFSGGTIASVLLVAVAIVLSGCNIDKESRIQVLLSDAEVQNFDTSRYSITRVDLVDANGQVTNLLDDRVEFDAFHLTGGLKGELVDEEVEPGSYDQLRIQMSRESMSKGDVDEMYGDEDEMNEDGIVDSANLSGDTEITDNERDTEMVQPGSGETVTETIPLQNVNLSDNSVLRITLDLNGTFTEPRIDTRDVQVLDREAVETDTNFVDLREGLETLERGTEHMVDSVGAALDTLGNRISRDTQDDDY